MKTISRDKDSDNKTTLTGDQNQPETISAIEGYNASSQFYTYGFDWKSDRLRWWMIHPVSADTLVLWNYQGTLKGIPQNKTYYRMNFGIQIAGRLRLTRNQLKNHYITMNLRLTGCHMIQNDIRLKLLFFKILKSVE